MQVNFGDTKLVTEIEPIIRVVPKPETMFFYERKDGSVFAVDEKQASRIHPTLRQWGVSDGTLYCQLIGEAKQRQDEALAAIQKKKIAKAKKEEQLQKIYAQAKTDFAAAMESEKEKAKGKFRNPGNFNDLSPVKLASFSPLMAGAMDKFLNE